MKIFTSFLGKKMRLILCILLLFYTVVIGCFSKSSSQTKFEVVCTITQLQDLVSQLTDDTISVRSICTSGEDPHTSVVTAGEVRMIQKAKVLYGIGLYLEVQMLHFLKEMPHAILVGEVAIDTNDLISFEKETSFDVYDPHIWGDVTLWMKVVRYIKQDLINRLPHQEESITIKTKQYLKKLEETHKLVQQRIDSIPKSKRILLTSHDAFGYFSRAYGLQNKSLLGISTVAEASSKEVIELSQWIIDKNITIAFGEVGVPNKFIEAAIKAAHSQGHSIQLSKHTLYSDSLGEKNSSASTYVDMILYNAKIISTELSHAQ